MARPAAIAVAGYYPFPPPLLPLAAGLVDVTSLGASSTNVATCDICAGDGAAIQALTDAWFGARNTRARVHEVSTYTCELEATRAAALHTRMQALSWADGNHALHADAFTLAWSTEEPNYEATTGVSILWLNPMYDTHPVHGRLEQTYLARFTALLAPGAGILLFVIPAGALTASATYLATHYTDIACVRLPDPDFAAYDQVIVVARRAAQPFPFDAAQTPVAADLRSWAAHPEQLAVLGTTGPLVTLRPHGRAGLTRFVAAPVDVQYVRDTVTPGQPRAAGRGRADRVLGLAGDALVSQRVYPVAQPLKPGHIGAALAAGLFNGTPVAPDVGRSGLPPILAKGVFRRERVTVDERTNADGEITGYIQIEQPLLQLCVLDLATGSYHDLATGSEPTGSTDLAAMNIADLLDGYGMNLGALLADQCPPLHHPLRAEHQLALPAVERSLLPVQRHAVQTAVKLLATGSNPPIIGEVGTGKTSVALATAWALAPANYQATRAELVRLGVPLGQRVRPVHTLLVVCPPHLLDSWMAEIAQVLPGARTVVLATLTDLEQLTTPAASPTTARPGAGLTIALLSREAAKLGHAYAGVARATCPRCGAPVHLSPSTLAAQRVRCASHTTVPRDAWAQRARDLARLLVAAAPQDSWVSSLTPERFFVAVRERAAATKAAMSVEEQPHAVSRSWQQRAQLVGSTLAASPVGHLLDAIRADLGDWIAGALATEHTPIVLNLLGQLAWAVDHPDMDTWLIDTITLLYTATLPFTDRYGTAGRVRSAVRTWTLLVADPERRAQLIATLKAHRCDLPSYGSDLSPWQGIDTGHAQLAQGTVSASYELPIRQSPGEPLHWHDRRRGDVANAVDALHTLAHLGRFGRSAACGEPLYQAVPEPRRYPLAKQIQRRYRAAIDMLVLDEAHEYATDGSAQSHAAHRLVTLNMPVVWLSGSPLNGYASGLFANLWSLSRAFRERFGRDEVSRFVTQYGYHKLLVAPEDVEEFRTLTYGRHTDRQERQQSTTVRTLGEAPGVLPLLLLDTLLPEAVVIHKADLELDLPPCTPLADEPVLLGLPSTDAVAAAMAEKLAIVQSKLLDQLKQDRFDKDYSGALFGALGELASFLDRCTDDTGNVVRADGTRAWEIRYPARLGGRCVATVDLLPASVRTPKERWLVDTLRAEWAANRRVMVFVTHTGKASGLVARLQGIIRADLGETAPCLDATKVPTGTRKDWIDRVIASGCRCLIVNPATVQTGLNNLVAFSTGLFYEQVNAHAVVKIQARGRLDRPGQMLPVTIRCPIYDDSLEQISQQLCARKERAIESILGLDVAGALDAAGAGTSSAVDAMSLGRAIYAILMQREEQGAAL